MTLIIDRTAQEQGPGLHVLLIGVSDYAHLNGDSPPDPALDLGFTKLASPALSAFKIYEWLTNPPASVKPAVPIKTVRLLISPSQREINADAGLKAIMTTPPARPTRALVTKAAREWHMAASKRRDDRTLFYFGGHGMRLSGEDAIMLFDDFADPNDNPFTNCSLIGRLRSAMAPTNATPEMARTQYYFVDCCRNLPDSVRAFDRPSIPDLVTPRLNVDESSSHTPTYFATPNGAIAMSRDGKTTLLCEALLHAFAHGADTPNPITATQDEWPVNVNSLKCGIDRYLMRTYGGGAPLVHRAGQGNPTFHVLDRPPEVDIDLSFLPPAAAAASATFSLQDLNAVGAPASFEPLDASTMTRKIRAGAYGIFVRLPGQAAAAHPLKVVSFTQKTPMPWPIHVPIQTS